MESIQARAYGQSMSPWMSAFIEFMFCVAAVQYLLGEATIFDRLRAKAPSGLKAMLACPSCAGFWIGMGVALLGVGPWDTTGWKGVLFSGLMAVATTPFIRGMMALGWAVSQSGGHDDHEGHDHEHPHQVDEPGFDERKKMYVIEDEGKNASA